MESTRDKLGRLQPAALLKVYSNTNFLQYVILEELFFWRPLNGGYLKTKRF